MRRGAVAGVVVAVLATGGAVGWHLATRAPVVELRPPRSAAVAVSAVSAAAAHVQATWPSTTAPTAMPGTAVTWPGRAGSISTRPSRRCCDRGPRPLSRTRSGRPAGVAQPHPRYRYVEAAAAGGCTTAADLTRLAAWLASDDPRAVDMRSPAAGTDGRYGLGVQRWGSDVVGHPGVNRGFHADLWVRPAAGAALVVLTNGDDGGRAADAIRDAWNDAA